MRQVGREYPQYGTVGRGCKLITIEGGNGKVKEKREQVVMAVTEVSK